MITATVKGFSCICNGLNVDDFTVKHRWRVYHYKSGTLAFRSLDPEVDPPLKDIIS